MKLARFSQNAFAPHFQEHIEIQINFLQQTPLSIYPEHLRYHIQQMRDDIHPDWRNLLTGVWAFVVNDEVDLLALAEDSYVQHQLSHLTSEQRERCKWSLQEWDASALCFKACDASILRDNQLVPLGSIELGEAVYIPCFDYPA